MPTAQIVLSSTNVCNPGINGQLTIERSLAALPPDKKIILHYEYLDGYHPVECVIRTIRSCFQQQHENAGDIHFYGSLIIDLKDYPAHHAFQIYQNLNDEFRHNKIVAGDVVVYCRNLPNRSCSIEEHLHEVVRTHRTMGAADTWTSQDGSVLVNEAIAGAFDRLYFDLMLARQKIAELEQINSTQVANNAQLLLENEQFKATLELIKNAVSPQVVDATTINTDHFTPEEDATLIAELAEMSREMDEREQRLGVGSGLESTDAGTANRTAWIAPTGQETSGD